MVWCGLDLPYLMILECLTLLLFLPPSFQWEYHNGSLLSFSFFHFHLRSWRENSFLGLFVDGDNADCGGGGIEHS